MGDFADAFGAPTAKRQKLTSGTSARNGSRIFAPYRTLGLVSPTSVPFTSVPLGKTTFQITTSIGRTIQTYDLRRGLNLVFLSRPPTPATITAICAHKDRVFVAWGGTFKERTSGVWMFKRGKLQAELEMPEKEAECITSILVFGTWIVGCGQRTLEVWKSDTLEHYTTLCPSSSDQHGGLTGNVCSLPTFLNKVFLGRKDGNVEVWNLSTARLVHTILPASSTNGSITAISATPALSVLAVAYSDGTIALRDIETDSIVLELRQSTPTTSIAFRTDGIGAGNDGKEEGIMATSRPSSGDITFWDLNEGGKVKGILRQAHDTSSSRALSEINRIEFLPGQPVLLSSGSDNSLKSWVFDEVPFSTIPRLLHSRSGHSAPITHLLFTPTASDNADASGKWLLSSSQDRSIWSFSTRKDGQNAELSQGHLKQKPKKGVQRGNRMDDLRAPEITSLACCLNRDGGMASAASGVIWSNFRPRDVEISKQAGWESVITTHKGDRFARTWSWGRRKAGRWAFETPDKTEATTCSITSCGTFALVGSAGGSLEMFNLQSGSHQQFFPPRPTTAQSKKQRLGTLQHGSDSPSALAHSRTVTGVAANYLNELVVSSGLDGTLKLWNFATGHHVVTVAMPRMAAITEMRYSPTSGLVSLSCDDFCIRLVDIETRRLVRELWGTGSQVYDHCFSHDGQWIVACSMDSVIRVWDLSTGNMIDAFRTASTCTSLAFSTSGEFLATSYANDCGIELWTNKSLYTNIPMTQVHDVHGIIDLSDFDPSLSIAEVLTSEDTNEALPFEMEQDGGTAASAEDQLSSDLITLSLVPRNRWESLLHLETIKERNRPVEPPKQPEKAPFFLQASSVTENVANSGTGDRPRISELQIGRSQASKITSLLSTTATGRPADIESFTKELASLSPAAADVEIRSLKTTELPTFVRAMSRHLQERKDYELVNTWMACFVNIHSEFVEDDVNLQQALLAWKDTLKKEEARLANVVGYCSGVIDFLRSGR